MKEVVDVEKDESASGLSDGIGKLPVGEPNAGWEDRSGDAGAAEQAVSLVYRKQVSCWECGRVMVSGTDLSSLPSGHWFLRMLSDLWRSGHG